MSTPTDNYRQTCVRENPNKMHVRSQVFYFPLRWKTRETLAGKNSQEKCAFYLVWEATIPLYDAEIYDTVLDTVTRNGESRKFENTRHLSKSLQSHVKKSRVVKNRSEIEQRMVKRTLTSMMDSLKRIDSLAPAIARHHATSRHFYSWGTPREKILRGKN
ncbi:uncharacterized protein LOC122571933 [Bombus pyrosoma]|uniref:uncharacterized protein LOC122571933 n=1 Tax=Bombus pyrosoma TaxID=396416 RepID=UPI001CB91687|nr:uncharacterized protein LOC122571933 [Bombus pyrosoma]XP_043592228.1 uncharacterized protein LOC122571933 [Bombus pyrosoma]